MASLVTTEVRERIMRMYRNRASRKQIADALTLPKWTVERIIKRECEKYGFKGVNLTTGFVQFPPCEGSRLTKRPSCGCPGRTVDGGLCFACHIAAEKQRLGKDFAKHYPPEAEIPDDPIDMELIERGKAELLARNRAGRV